MEQSPSWRTNWFASSQEIPRISRNPKVHYRTHKRPPPVSILDQPNPVHIPISHLLEIHPNIIHPPKCGLSKRSLSFRSPHQNPEYSSLLAPYVLHASPISIFSILNNIPHHHQLYCVDRFPKVFYKGEVPRSNLGLWLPGFNQSVLINSKFLPKLGQALFALIFTNFYSRPSIVLQNEISQTDSGHKKATNSAPSIRVTVLS